MKKLRKILGGIILAIVLATAGLASAYADSGITLSPMNVRISLTPGETYEGSFTIANPARNDETYHYGVSVSPFYVNDEYEVYFSANGSYGEIADWITVDEITGEIDPNESTTIHYTINVPNDAPAGGQYAAIHIGSTNSPDTVNEGINLEVTYGIAYIIYAEVIGSVTRGGEILSADVPSFLLSGNIAGMSSIKNLGNVHGVAKYTLQIYPLFSDEEIYTNEETPDAMTILPERTYFSEISWLDTPAMGIFKVVYTVEFEGATKQVSKMVIKCPIWLLFIIIFAIAAIIIYFVMRAKSRKNTRKRIETQ